jgi:hypothetical protein
MLAVALGASGLVSGVALPTASAVGGGAVVATVTGTVERVHLDDFDHPLPADADEITFVRTTDGSLQVPAHQLAEVPDGATVRLGLADTRSTRRGAHGTLVADLSATEVRNPEAGPTVASVVVTAAPAAQAAVSAGVHSVLVVIAKPPGGGSSSYVPSALATTVNGAISTYWSTVTGGAVSFNATAYPSVVATTNAPCNGNGDVSSSNAFWNEVKSRTGFATDSTHHLVVYFPKYTACGGIAGLGSVGGGVVWSNGYAVGYQGVGVIGHELGHNLGLGHSQLLDCSVGGVRVLDADPAGCSARSYADTNDIMGISWNNQGFLNAVHLRTLGLVASGGQVTPTDNGTVTLVPIENATGQRVLTLSDGGTHYVVELRRPVGRDTWLTTYPAWGSSGVTVRREFDPVAGTGFSPIESYLLDGDPSTADAGFGSMSNALPVDTWLDLDGGKLGIRVISVSATDAVVEYRNGYPSADPRYVPPPMPVVSVPSARLTAGAMKPSAYGPSVPVLWQWQVTTPTAGAAAAAAVSNGSAVTPTVRMAASGWLAASYRATAVATNGTAVSSTGHTSTHYTSETYTRYVHYTSGWVRATTSAAMSGAVRLTTKKGGAVSFRASARSVGLLLVKSPNAGSVAIYVDNHRVAVLSLRASRTSVALAWTTKFGTVGSHVVTIVNLTGGTRGQVGFDGFASTL